MQQSITLITDSKSLPAGSQLKARPSSGLHQRFSSCEAFHAEGGAGRLLKP